MQEYIDNHPVVSHRIRFTGRAEIRDDDATLVKDGATVVWLVKAHCLPPQYHPTAKDAEDRYRFNIQEVQAAAPLDGELRDQAIAFIDHGTEQAFLDEHGDVRLPFDNGFDVEAETYAVRELREVYALLAELGELHEDERPVDAMRRVLERRFHTVNLNRIEFAALGEEG